MSREKREIEPGRRSGSRTPARKANELGFRTRTLSREKGEIEPGRRHGSRTPARKANEFGFRARIPGRKKKTRRIGCQRVTAAFVFNKYNLTESDALCEKKFKSMSYEVLPS